MITKFSRATAPARAPYLRPAGKATAPARAPYLRPAGKATAPARAPYLRPAGNPEIDYFGLKLVVHFLSPRLDNQYHYDTRRPAS